MVPGTGFGLGWGLRPAGWSHSGALTTGTHSILERLDDGLTWAVVYNSLPADPERDLDGLRATVAISIDEVRAAVIESMSGPRK